MLDLKKGMFIRVARLKRYVFVFSSFHGILDSVFDDPILVL